MYPAYNCHIYKLGVEQDLGILQEFLIPGVLWGYLECIHFPEIINSRSSWNEPVSWFRFRSTPNYPALHCPTLHCSTLHNQIVDSCSLVGFVRPQIFFCSICNFYMWQNFSSHALYAVQMTNRGVPPTHKRRVNYTLMCIVRWMRSNFLQSNVVHRDGKSISFVALLISNVAHSPRCKIN